MASEVGQQPFNIVRLSKLPESLINSPRSYDWFAALLLIEANANPPVKRIGELGRPREEIIRLGQRPSVHFSSQEIAAIDQSTHQDGVPWLMQYFFGVFGANGPLPLHLTEYAIERKKYHRDPVFTRFVDIFHHRMLSLFYRTWRLAQPTADFLDRQEPNYRSRLQQLTGLPPQCISTPTDASRQITNTQKQEFDQTFAGLLASRTKTTNTLIRVVEHFTGANVHVQANIPSWLNKDDDQFFLLGKSMSQLGVDSQLGRRVLSIQSQIYIEIGPLSKDQYDELLPKGLKGENTSSRDALYQLIHKIVGFSINTVIQLVVNFDHKSELGKFRLGYDSWLGKSEKVRRGCVIDE